MREVVGARLRACAAWRRQQRRASNRRSRAAAAAARRGAAQQLRDAAGEPEHHQRVEREQRQRREQDRPAQVLRLADPIGLEARVERREVERRQPVGGRQRVDGQQSFRRAVEAGRMVGVGAAGVVRPAPAARSAAAARTRRSRRACGSAAPPRARRWPLARRHRWSAVEPASATMRLSMSTKVPDSGRSDQRVSAVTWNSTIMPLPRRCAVTSGVPSASVAQVRSARPASGSASTCRVTVTSFGTGMPLNGLSRENARAAAAGPSSGCRRGCGRRGAASPARDRRRRRRAAGRRSAPARRRPRSSAASRSRASPATLPTSARMIIGTFCSMKRRTASAGDAALGEPHVGERVERARQIIGRGEQRLRGVGGRAGDDADGAPAPALVEQLHRAGRALGRRSRAARCRCGSRPAG